MPRPTFTVIVPTSGRPTLAAALASVSDQLEPGDELILVCSNDGDFGNAARNAALERARGSHLVFLDDDDEYLPGGFATMRGMADKHPGRLLVFLKRWEVYGDAYGAVTAAVFPNLPGKLGRFAPADDSIMRDLRPGETVEQLRQRRGDMEFVRTTLELQGGELLHIPQAVYVVRPEKSRWRRFRFRLDLRRRLGIGRRRR